MRGPVNVKAQRFRVIGRLLSGRVAKGTTDPRRFGRFRCVLAIPDRNVTVRFCRETNAMSRLDGEPAIVMGDASGIGMRAVRRLAAEAVCRCTRGRWR
jgi:hypothetical protein